jgi:2-haloalkanoic acid dehalogenase type II
VPFKAVIFDAYGTLVRNDALRLIPQRIVADHGLSTSVDDVLRRWVELYFEATQRAPFRALRHLERSAIEALLCELGVESDPTPYVDLFFRVTTKVELYPEVADVLRALPPLRSAVLSNADHEHLAAWAFTLPVEFVLISEAVGAYKPAPLMFQAALERFGLAPHEVLHVGDSEVDDVDGAKAAGLRAAWLNRSGRRRRASAWAPDFEIRDLKELLALL